MEAMMLNWNRGSACGSKDVSLPFMYIDNFTLYWNTHRSLMNVYIIPVGLDIQEQNKPSNVFVQTVNPYGS